MTANDRKIAEAFYHTAVLTMHAVAMQHPTPFMRVIPNDTGTGKTSLTCALIAAAAIVDADFSAAFFAPTVQLAIEVQEGIETLLGTGTTTLWSNYHDPGRNEQETQDTLGFLPTRLCRKHELPNSRIVIGTTAKLKQEAKAEEDTGCLRYLGHWRSIVFIDEFPDLLDLYEVTTPMVQGLHEQLANHDPAHRWLPVLEKAIGRMMPVMRTTGQTYWPVTVLDAGDDTVFEGSIHDQLMRLTDDDWSDEERLKQAESWREAVEFLQAAVRDQVYYSRQDHRFYGYRRHLDTSYPGYVVLDGTADIHGALALMPGVEIVPGERLHYDQLELYAIVHPEDFADIHKLNAADTRRYAHWIQNIVISNTQPGDEVLVVTHKKVLEMEMFAGSGDLATSLDWDGRKVNTQHWGAGVGTNRFGHKTCVFLFGDYHQRRAVTIAQMHGWSGDPMTEQDLQQAKGTRQRDGRPVPGGRYGSVSDGHLLRWVKQLAMRGNARNADAAGQCGRMKLFLSGNPALWRPRMQDLFPGAAFRGSADQDGQGTKRTGRDGLRHLLLISEKSVIGADEVEAETGIKKCNVSREYEAIQDFAQAQGWSLWKAGDLGRAGRQRYLVHEQQYGRQRLKKTG